MFNVKILWFVTRRLLPNNVYYFSDYGPIDENVSNTNDQFKIESKRKAKYKNNDQKVSN